MTEDVEQKIKELEEELNDRNKSENFIVRILKNINQKILDSNGFLTSEGKYLCKAEWHAVAMPIGFISSAFILEKLGVIVFATFFLMYRRGFNLAEKPNYNGHWNDVIDESAYTAIAMLATIIYWTYYTSETIEGFEAFGGAIGRILLGA